MQTKLFEIIGGNILAYRHFSLFNIVDGNGKEIPGNTSLIKALRCVKDYYANDNAKNDLMDFGVKESNEVKSFIIDKARSNPSACDELAKEWLVENLVNGGYSVDSSLTLRADETYTLQEWSVLVPELITVIDENLDKFLVED